MLVLSFLLLSNSLLARIHTISAHEISPNKLMILIGDIHEPNEGSDYSEAFFSNLEKKEANRIKFLIEGGEASREISRKYPSYVLNHIFIKSQGFPSEIAAIFASVLYPDQQKKYEAEDCNLRSKKILEIPQRIVDLRKSNDIIEKAIVYEETIQMIKDEIKRVSQTLIKLYNIDGSLAKLLKREIDIISKNLELLQIDGITFSEFMNRSYLDFVSLSQDIDAFYMALSSPHNAVVFYGGFEHTATMRKISSEMSWRQLIYASEDGDIGLQEGFSRLNQEFDQFMSSVNNKCTSCGNLNKKLLSCSRCKKAKYCDEKCQKDDWKSHKGNCKSTT